MRKKFTVLEKQEEKPAASQTADYDFLLLRRLSHFSHSHLDHLYKVPQFLNVFPRSSEIVAAIGQRVKMLLSPYFIYARTVYVWLLCCVLHTPLQLLFYKYV